MSSRLNVFRAQVFEGIFDVSDAELPISDH